MARDTPEARRVDILTCYDLLGPLSKQAVAESPLDLHVGGMLNAAPIHLIDDDGWDDAKLADWIRRTVAARVKMPPDRFMLVPRRDMQRQRFAHRGT